MSYLRVQKSFLKLKPSNSVFYRLQSNSAGKRSGVKVAVYGLTLTSATVIGASVAYANYDPQFKMTVDSYVPGFGSFTERSTVLWNKGVELAGEGWKNAKKVILPEKSDKVGLHAPKSGDKDLQTSPIVPVETITTTPTVSSVVSSESKPNEETTEPITDNTSIPTEEEHIATTPTETVPPETVHVPTEAKPTEITPTETITTTEATVPTKAEAAVPTEITPTETLSTDTVPSVTTLAVPTDITDSVLPPPSSDTITPIDSLSSDVQEESSNKDKIPESVIHLEDTFKEFTASADVVIESLNNLVNALKIHQLQVSEAAKSPPKDERDMDILVGSIIGTEEAVDNARKQLERAKNKHQNVSLKLVDDITAARKDGANEIVEQICDKIGNYSESFEQGERKVMEAEKSNQTHIKELEDTSTPIGDQDRILLMARIASLEKEIKSMKVEEEKMTEVLASQTKEQDEVIKEKILLAIKEKEEEFKEKLENLEIELERNYEEKIKEQLYSQAKAHIAHAKNALIEQAERLTEELEEKHDKREKELANDYQMKLATAYAHLKGIHSVIDSVVESSDSIRRQQSVRVASDTLTNALISANSDPDPYKLHSIASEVNSLLKVAQNDTFISTMLSSIPQEVLSKGISSEAGLKSRFVQVKHIASRVALVPEEGGGLGTYLLSFLQSLLTIDMIHTRMIELHKTDPQSLSTFDLLRQAKLSLDHGDLEKAVKFVAQLKGESRRVSQDWLHEALKYLETRQAIIAITQYLAASNTAVLK